MDIGRKGQAPEQITGKLREAGFALAKGKTVAETCRTLGVCEETFYRWSNNYGGLKIDQAKKLKALERENTRLKRAVAVLTLDKLIPQEAARGNFQGLPGAGSALLLWVQFLVCRNGAYARCGATSSDAAISSQHRR